MANTYLVGHITVKDKEKWQEYRSKVSATIEKFGGELVFRGSLDSVLSGSHKHQDTVVIKFPNMQSLNDWYNSPQYQSIIPIRDEAAIMDLLTYEV
ncbi:MAG: DUF1330 domain-containing protein [Gammaproteobacteria bacterium]|nr:DUF1330 domain-containing protein [Gammaproteobacteria bacterium]